MHEPVERGEIGQMAEAAEKEHRVRLAAAGTELVPGRVDACAQAFLYPATHVGNERCQVFTVDNREYLASFVPHVGSRIQEGLRAGIDTSRYEFRACGREPYTMLFLGSFRHLPNFAALDWFVHRVLPRILERRPEARLIVVGSDPPPPHVYGDFPNAIDVVGFVEDIRRVLERYAVFVCPILSGSGVRVKLLEAFAS